MKPHKALWIGIGSLLAFAVSSKVFAAQAPVSVEPASKETPATQTSTTEMPVKSEPAKIPEPTTPKPTPTAEKDESFVPTVEISEDLSVSFPVDI